MPHTSLATVGQIAWRLLEMHRIDPAPLFAQQGIDAGILQEPNARIPVARWDAIVRRAAQLDPGPGFALAAAKCWHPSNLGPLGFAWLSSPTLRAGLQRLMRYWKLIGERSALRLEESDGATRLVFSSGSADPVVSGLVADLTLAVVFSMCRMNYGESLRALELGMRYVWPGEQEAYERHFECPVVCNAPEDWLTLRKADLDAPLPTANKEVAASLDRILAEQLAHLDRNNVVARCKASLLEQLSEGDLSEEDMAQQLHMSRRTLQRKLADAEMTYQRLVDETRRDLALAYIEDPRHSIIDITFMLGFSQQSAFTRAFKRWTGVAPSEYRQRVRETAGKSAAR
jgi:AraC-like DNA-binding protein